MDRRTGSAIATGLVLVALTWMTVHGLLFYRPLPVIDGYYRFLGLDQRAEVVRDAFGVPRIEAGTLHDLFFLQGYVTAQDRFAQMEAMRGRSVFFLNASEQPDPAATADPAVTAALDAYAQGVTKYIDQHAEARALPAEIALGGRRPRAWEPTDSLAILAFHLEVPSSSLCVTVKGDRTARESPLLAAELNIDAPPPGWYEIGIAGAGLRAVGLSLPGVPGIVAGHNGVVAWSFHARPGEPLDPAGSVAALLGAAGASEASTILERKVELAGCAADTGGVTVVLAPSRGIPLGAVLVSGASALTAQVMDATVEAGRGIDVEGLRLVLGDASPGVAAARIVIDLGDLDASRAALSTGQSGHPAAFHYRDQAQLWTTGQLHRLAWTRDAVARTEGRLVLRPR